MSPDLTAAREALAATQAPRCLKEFRPDPRYTDTDPCGLVRGHVGRCDHARIPNLADHLRTALAAVDALTAELAEARAALLNERGEGEPPGEGWAWDKRYGLWRGADGAAYVSRRGLSGWDWHADVDGRGAARFCILDPEDTTPCWDDIVDAASKAGREEGRRAGLEEAARETERRMMIFGCSDDRHIELERAARSIRALATKEPK